MNLNKVTEMFNYDLTFLISKALVNFIKRYLLDNDYLL